MWEQVVRVGKYAAAGSILLAALPFLIPLVFALFCFGFVFVLPVGCSLAGFLYLRKNTRKYAGILYLFFSDFRESSGGRPALASSGNVRFSALAQKDSESIETFEVVDREFDAVLVSTCPTESQESGTVPVPVPEVGNTEEDNFAELVKEQPNAFSPDLFSSAEENSANFATGRSNASFEEKKEKEGQELEKTDSTDDSANTINFEQVSLPTEMQKSVRTDEKENSLHGVEEDSANSLIDRPPTTRAGKDEKTEGMSFRSSSGHDHSHARIDEQGEEENQQKTSTEYCGKSVDDGTNASLVEKFEDREEQRSREEEEQESTEGGKIDGNALIDTLEGDIQKDGGENRIVEPLLGTLEEAERLIAKETGEVKEDKPIALSDDRGHAEESEVEREDVSKMEEVNSFCNSPEALVQTKEVSMEPDVQDDSEASNLLPHQANEEDVWICKECGWKYPNAKPSAKVRRNHRKHCNGHPSTITAPADGLSTEGSSELDLERVSSDGFENTGSDCKPTGSDDSSHEDNKISEKLETAAGAEIAAQSTEVIDPEGRASPQESYEYDLQWPPEDERESKKEQESLKLEKSHSWLLESPQVESREPGSNSVALDNASLSSSPSGINEQSGSLVASDSFRSASDILLPDENVQSGSPLSLPAENTEFDDQQDRPTQVREELQLQDDLQAIKRIVGDKNVSRGPFISEIEELSEFLGIDLPVRSADMSESEWSKLSIEVMKVVVGVD